MYLTQVVSVGCPQSLNGAPTLSSPKCADDSFIPFFSLSIVLIIVLCLAVLHRCQSLEITQHLRDGLPWHSWSLVDKPVWLCDPLSFPLQPSVSHAVAGFGTDIHNFLKMYCNDWPLMCGSQWNNWSAIGGWDLVKKINATTLLILQLIFLSQHGYLYL